MTALEDQPTETTSEEVESAPSPDSDTGQESLATSGEATVSGGVQRDQHAPGDDEPEAARDPRLADVARSLAANQGPIHTWQDGDNTRRVWLQNGLVVQPRSKDAPDDVVLRSAGGEIIVERPAKHNEQQTPPVFRSESGILMTLSGGVILVLEESWAAPRVAQFF